MQKIIKQDNLFRNLDIAFKSSANFNLNYNQFQLAFLETKNKILEFYDEVFK
jgi:hypothetical protein